MTSLLDIFWALALGANVVAIIQAYRARAFAWVASLVFVPFVSAIAWFVSARHLYARDEK